MYRPTGPPPPDDPELCDTINRFAAYIAKNGPAVEEMERKTNYGNPAMSFLFDGNGTSYYQYRLAIEITNLKNMAQPPQPTPLSDIRVPPPLQQQQMRVPNAQSSSDPEIEPLEAQIQALKQQIVNSETNLKAHYDAMQDTKKTQVNKLYSKREIDRIFVLLDRVGIDPEPFVKMLDHLNVSASKETIAKCKHWIFTNCDTDQKKEIVLTYLLHRCRSDESDGNLPLHILYLMNDWAYYCQRQKLDNKMLSRYVPKMFAHATLTNKISEKLDRLVGVWEGGRYFDENCYKQLINPTNVLELERSTIAADKAQIEEQVEKELRQTYSNYQKQHTDYERHILAQIAVLQNQIVKIQEMRAERSRLQNVQFEERLIPKAPFYELPAGMFVPLIKPECVTFEPIDPSLLRLPAPNLLTDRLKHEVDRFYAMLHNPPADRFDKDGWEIKGLTEFYAIKNHHKTKLFKQLHAEGKTLEDAITNKLTEQLEQDKAQKPVAKKRNSSGSPSPGSSDDSGSSSSRSGSNSPRQKFVRSRSASPDQRSFRKRDVMKVAFFGASEANSDVGFIRPSSSEESLGFKMPGLPLQREGNKGAQLLQKMGYSGGGLGVDGKGIEEPISVNARHPQDMFKGVGSKGDHYDEYRKRMSQRTYGDR